MIPILYESDEINFISNGIGRLRDCIRCEVTEERNGIYECEFEYPVTGQHFDDIKCGRIIAVEHDEAGDVQPFDIISYTRPLNGVVTFHAQHISYRQKGITVIASSGSSRSLRSAFATLKSGSPSNPFNYYSDISGQRRVAAFDLTPRTARQILGGIEGSILDAFGGEYEWDKFNVNLWKNRGEVKDYTIRYGVNLLEFQEELDTSEAYNACIPYWKGEDDLVLADPAMITAGESYNGRINCAPLDLTDKFEEKPTAAQVTAAGQSYMSSNQPYLPSQTISINFVRLQDSDEYEEYAALQKCSLCDSVKVVFPMYGVTGSFKIVKVVWDVLLERYIEMDLGNLYTTLSQALGIGGIQASADQANRNVTGAWGTAADAQATASAASQAASAAQASATSASEAATNAWNHADEANQAATEAKESARSANNSANNALVQLSVVEDVAGTLRWISEHGDYVLTEDDHVVSGTVYFVKQGGDYIPIASPDPTKNPSAEGWYVLDVSQSTTDYIMAHLAVTSYGLWVLPVNNLAEHFLKDSNDNLIVDSNGDEIVDFSDDPQNASGYKVLISGGTSDPNFPIGLSIYNDEGESVANYGVTTRIGAESGYNTYIDSTGLYVRDELIPLAKYGQTTIFYEPGGQIVAAEIGSTGLVIKKGSIQIGSKTSASDVTNSGTYIDASGNMATSNIKAHGGTIGGWTINGTDGLYYDNTSSGSLLTPARLRVFKNSSTISNRVVMDATTTTAMMQFREFPVGGGTGKTLDVGKYDSNSWGITSNQAMNVTTEKSLNIYGTTGLSVGTSATSVIWGVDGAWIRPETNSGASLGHNSYRWKEVYCTRGAFNGSDLKEKSVIDDFDWKVDEFISGLKPIAFQRINNDKSVSKRISLGFGAQDVARLSKDIGIGDLRMYEASIIETDENGEKIAHDYHGEEIDDSKLTWSLNYTEFIAPMVLEIQRLMNRVKELEDRLNG